jgi:hypothetical protein
MDEEKMVWCGGELPGARDADGTYGVWPYKTVPRLDHGGRNPFRNVKTLDDLHAAIDLMHESPTACYFRLDRSDGSFWRDQQDCVVWAFDAATGGVFMLDQQRAEGEQEKTFVAKSLAEFLWRVDLENQIWFLRNSHDGERTDDADAYLEHYAALVRGTEAELAALGCRQLRKWMTRQYQPRCADPGQLWRNVGLPSRGHAVLLDKMCDRLEFRSTFFGPFSLTDASLKQLDETVAERNAFGKAAALTWMLFAKRMPRLDRNVALIIARCVYEQRFDHN